MKTFLECALKRSGFEIENNFTEFVKFVEGCGRSGGNFNLYHPASVIPPHLFHTGFCGREVPIRRSVPEGKLVSKSVWTIQIRAMIFAEIS